MTSDDFACMVFDDKKMSKYLSHKTYNEYKRCLMLDAPVSLEAANEIARAMCTWALERGATHYAQKFYPLTGSSAQKHVSLYEMCDGKAIAKLNGETLLKGEVDASSFPSGGLRAPSCARGYTAWDPTSYAFVKDHTLYIPSLFFSFCSEALDEKIPLLRSIETVNKSALRLLSLLGSNATRVNVNVGAEQEYFLIDLDLCQKRKDLQIVGRTLFDARAEQSAYNRYLSAIEPRVFAFMKELDEELWKLGILVKTEHSEASPSQFEFAPIFTLASIAHEQNQLTIETMKQLATKHNFACLLHEKPFNHANGSGKHVNWSLSIQSGENLFAPDKGTINTRFLIMLCAVISAANTHQDLIRAFVSSAANDCRLGAKEAPPTIVSVALGEDIAALLSEVAMGCTSPQNTTRAIDLGIGVLPTFFADNTDRNRTSPLAFTGDRFEFRMPGAQQSVASITTLLNTIVSEQFSLFADELEHANSIEKGILEIIKRVMHEHGRIIFNGDNYSAKWQVEAQKRGLLNLKSTADALPYLTTTKSINLFEKMCVLTKTELCARQEVMAEQYCKDIDLEANTMLDIVTFEIIPSLIKRKSDILASAKDSLALELNADIEINLATSLSQSLADITALANALRRALKKAKSIDDKMHSARIYHDDVLSAMTALRERCNEII